MTGIVSKETFEGYRIPMPPGEEYETMLLQHCSERYARLVAAAPRMRALLEGFTQIPKVAALLKELE